MLICEKVNGVYHIVDIEKLIQNIQKQKEYIIMEYNAMPIYCKIPSWLFRALRKKSLLDFHTEFMYYTFCGLVVCATETITEVSEIEVF